MLKILWVSKVVASWDSSSSGNRVVDEVEAELSVKRVVDVIEKLSLDWVMYSQSVHIHSIARLLSSSQIVH